MVVVQSTFPAVASAATSPPTIVSKRALQDANALVERIYQQLTEGDAPTINEQPQPQQHVNPAANGGSSPISSDSATSQSIEDSIQSIPYDPSSSLSAGSQRVITHNHHQIQNSHRLGHAGLATLCAQTIVQPAVESTSSVVGDNKNHPTELSSTTISSTSRRINQTKSPSSPLLVSKQQQQQIKVLRISSPSHQPPKASINNSNATIVTDASQFPPSSLRQQQQQQLVKLPPPQPKLHMFGSEYARHLSTSQLAPATNNEHGHNHHKISLLRKQQQQAHAPPLFRRLDHGNTNRKKHSRLMPHRRLDQASNEIQTGALLDIICSRPNEAPPTGYYRIDAPPACWNNNKSNGGGNSHHKFRQNNNNSVIMNVKKESSWDKAAQRPCITAITVIFPGRNEIVPPGFSLVRWHKTNIPVEFYSAAGPAGDHQHHCNTNDAEQQQQQLLYLCIRRSREGNPVTDVKWLAPPAFIPNGYTVVERSPRNHVAAFGSGGVGNSYTATHFIAYRQRLASLEALRPPPLVRTVLDQQEESSFSLTAVTASPHAVRTEKKSNKRRLRLLSYYTTGGATVHSESLGRFHILDRSTHSLISPSAIFNRLNIIESSNNRRRSNSAGGAASSSLFQLCSNSTIYARSDVDDTPGNENDDDDDTGSDRPPSFPLEHASAVPPPPPLISSVDELGRLIVDEDDILMYINGDHEQKANISSLLVRPNDEDDLDGGHHGCSANEGADNSLMEAASIYERAMDFIPAIATFRPDASLQRRIALITPILTACYTRHGGAAWAAINGLTHLLAETDFFLPDAAESADAMVGVTLLDLSIQAVCDVATSGVQESHFAACVEFVEAAVRHSQGCLGARTVGFIVRFYLFVFYFDASAVQSNQSLPLVSWRPTSMKQEEDFPFLFEPDERKTYLSGGSAQSAVLALKELVSLTVARLRRVSKDTGRKSPATNACTTAAENDSYKTYFGGIIAEAIGNAFDCVERSRLTQLAIHQIHRSGGSELFWHEMVHACGRELFSGDSQLSAGGVEVYGVFFALLETIIKTASGKIRSSGTDGLLPKDLACKLLSLELLLHTLECLNDEQDPATGKASHDVSVAESSLGYAIRRTVVPCLLWNTRAGLECSQVFRRLMRILSELWCSSLYRSHCKLELAVLIEHFALNLLELGPQCFEDGSASDGSPSPATTMLVTQQNEVILEIRNWFANNPNDAVDLFLNYDTDLTYKGSGPVTIAPGKRSRLFQRLCSGLGRIAERCDEIIGEQIRMNQSLVMSRRTFETSLRNSHDKLRIEAARLLRKSSLEALAQIVKAVAVSAGTAIGGEYAALFSSWCHDYEAPTTKLQCVPNGSSQSKSTAATNDSVVGFWNMAIVKDKIRKSAAAVPTRKESIVKSFAIAKEKSVKKAIEFLTACNVLKPSPREIASFLFAHKERFDPADLGLFLSEAGTGGQEVEHWKMVRYLYIRSMSFIDLQVDDGLRHFLSTCGFQLPAEAQKIDRLLCSFAQCFFEDNAGDNTCCPFKDEDTVYLLVFAIVMLNTDLHKVDNPKSKRRHEKKMTKADFTNNLKNAVQSEGVPKAFLGRVYDAILAKPISLLDCNVEHSGNGPSTAEATVEQIVAVARKADALLRSSAVHEYPLLSITDLVENLHVCGDDAATDVSRSCVSRTWHYWYGAVNSCLSTAHLDPHGLVPAIDVLVYGLSVAVCLDMPMECSAFLWQVVRLRSFDDRRHGHFLDDETAKVREEKWFAELENACTGLMESKLTVLRKIHEWGKTLRLRLQLDVTARMELSVAVKELEQGDYLLHDPARTFLQSGSLMKISARTGRAATYRFYLFSDVLLYASKDPKDPDGRYKAHEDLPLHLMKIVDWFPQKQKNRNLMFAIHHPRKTFHVLCPSVVSRKAWVEDIRAAIMVELERKMAIEAARLSAAMAGQRD